MTIGENIKKARLEKGMTQGKLGEHLGGLSQQQIGQWETGKANPKIETLRKIAAVLDIDVLFLLCTNEQDIISATLKNLPTPNKIPKYAQKYLALVHTRNEAQSLRDVKVEGTDGITTLDGVIISDQKLLKEFHELNTLGKKEAILRVSELKHIPGYTGDDDLPFN